MHRRNFLKTGLFSGIAGVTAPAWSSVRETETTFSTTRELTADVVIVGGGLGGCAAALASLRNGMRVVMTEETDWIGGQLTSQGVPPDENPWIETHGATKAYRDFRTAIRQYYIRHFPLTDKAKALKHLNPGGGSVSTLCHEPKVALAVLYELLNPYLSSGKLRLLTETHPVAAEVNGDRVEAVRVRGLRSGRDLVLKAPCFIDATELGDLLPLTGTEFVAGTESKRETNELHAPETADPDNQQAFTVCFAMDYEKGADHVIEKPSEYTFWKDFVPKMSPPWSGKLLDLAYCNPPSCRPVPLGFNPEIASAGGVLNLWIYRRIVDRRNFLPDSYVGDMTLVNWPQNDYLLGTLDKSREEFDLHVGRAKQLSLSLLYWLQTEAPGPDGGRGWPGLRLRADVMGTEDGLAKYPYVRESRRIKAVFTVLEEHVGKEQRSKITGKTESRAAPFHDTVGIGYYQIDLHPSSAGNNYIDFGSLPFQIPLGALIPCRMKNLLAACKNIGTTHITNGCYRLHPVEWNVGEAAGMLAAYVVNHETTPHAVRENEQSLADFQDRIRSQGVLTHWPE